ncbi:hypothetical protein JGU63_13875, partial [Staphylococcus aureus]|nr:hypothetical protein [Staphylococcus aureus]
DLSMAFDIVNKRKERKKQVEQAKQQPKNNLHVFIINNDKDAQLAKLLLEQNNIEFTQEIK